MYVIWHALAHAFPYPTTIVMAVTFIGVYFYTLFATLDVVTKVISFYLTQIIRFQATAVVFFEHVLLFPRRSYFKSRY